MVFISCLKNQLHRDDYCLQQLVNCDQGDSPVGQVDHKVVQLMGRLVYKVQDVIDQNEEENGPTENQVGQTDFPLVDLVLGSGEKVGFVVVEFEMGPFRFLTEGGRRLHLRLDDRDGVVSLFTTIQCQRD